MISRRSRCSRISRCVALGQRVGEVALEVVLEVWIVGEIGVEQLLEQVDLAVRDQRRQLGRQQTSTLGPCARSIAFSLGRNSSSRFSPAVLLERPDQPRVDVDHRDRLRAREAQRLRLRVAAVQHLVGDRVGHLDQQRVALLRRSSRRRAIRLPSRILMLTSWSEQLTPADVVDRVGVDPPALLLGTAAERVLDPPALGEAEVASLADDPAAQRRPRRPGPRRWPCRRRRRASRRSPSRRCRCRR